MARDISGRHRITVVEDDVVIRQVMTLALSDDGYVVSAWTAESDPVDFLRQSHPDLMMLDLHLNGRQDGIALVEAVRRDPLLAHLPLLVCTADSVAILEHHEQLERLNAHVVEKPFDLDDLSATIASLLREPLPSCDSGEG